MALKKLQTLSYQSYLSHVNTSIEEINNQLEEKQEDYWYNLLRRYEFDGYDYKKGIFIRNEFNTRLASAQDINEIINISNEIMDWGKMDPLNESMEECLENTLGILKSAKIINNKDFKRICVHRLASITKIYEMWDLNQWVIYDSYCVLGLQSMINDYWSSNPRYINQEYLKLPWPPGRTGKPICGFPRTADTAPRQKRLGFLYGSWFCRAVSEQLNNRNCHNFKWKPFHIEMAAFQLGHEL